MMIKEKDIKLFHEKNLQREIIPSDYELFHTNNIKLDHDNYIHSNIKTTGNISRYQEDHFIYSNPNQPYYKIPKNLNKLKNDEKYQFKFNNIINVEKNKLMTYFLCNSYEKLFSLYELYMVNLFNGINLELIPELFKKELITDSIYINAMKCIQIIDENKQKYKRIYIRNNNNYLETTEIICKIEEEEDLNCRDDALLLTLKFIDLLKSIDEKK